MIERILFIIKKFIPRRLFLFSRPAYHFLISFFAAAYYVFPSRKLRVIGVTGTGGKTTVVELLHKILLDSGVGVASVSSLRFKINDRETLNSFKMTMPGRFFIQKFLRRAVKNQCKYVVLEVTSEGIKQFRHRFIKFDVAVMTNVSPEHIESHGSFEKYLRSKLDLFWRLASNGVAVINIDDHYSSRFSAATVARKIFYGKSGINPPTFPQSIDPAGRTKSHAHSSPRQSRGVFWEGGGINIGDKKCKVSDLEILNGGIRFDLDGKEISSPLIGEFNFYNLLAAISVGLVEHISIEKMSGSILSVMGIPGRLEFVQKEPFAVVVDYAHTPDSLKKLFDFLRESSFKFQVSSSKLICVLGSAGGGRDKWKRPEMGKIAGEFCSHVIITNEDPYDENPRIIMEEICRGAELGNASYEIIEDRRLAIKDALEQARLGDTVIITGKGAEQYIMGPNGQKIEWGDRKVVLEELLKRGSVAV